MNSQRLSAENLTQYYNYFIYFSDTGREDSRGIMQKYKDRKVLAKMEA